MIARKVKYQEHSLKESCVMSERLCKDCKHYYGLVRPNFTDPDKCHGLDDFNHPIFGGKITGIDAGLVRMTLCGWTDPKYWEKKNT